MKPKRYLTDAELNKIRFEEDMLKGNFNRMCVTDDSDELLKMFHYANLRLKNIYNICVGKFIEKERNINDDK